MQAIILADGDVGSRAALDRAWPSWCNDGAVVVAADGGARHAAELGLTIDHWVGDGDSLGPAGVEALRRAGVPVVLAPTDKDESDTELALDAALALGVDSIAIVGALGGPRIDHALANVAMLGLPDLAGIDVRLIDATVRLRLVRGPGDGGRQGGAHLDGRPGDLISILPVGRDARGISTTGLRYPLRDEDLLVGRSRGLSNVRLEPVATVRLRDGRLLITERPATLPAMDTPIEGAVAPAIDLPDEAGTAHRLADQRGRWTVLFFYPKDDTPGCTIEACEFRDTDQTFRERGTDVWGISPQGSASKRAFREKFELPFVLLADERHAAADAYGAWRERVRDGVPSWGTARMTFLIDPVGVVARVWPTVKPEGHAAEVLAALDGLQAAG